MGLGVGVTAETLRHYDRQGLAGPSERDEVSGYRYYTEADLIRLRVAKALRDMGLSIPEAKALLDSDDLGWVASRLREAESRAGERIEEIAAAKARIAAARESYEAKLAGGQARVAEERTYPERRILVSDSIAWPSLGVLWGYLRHFHAQAGDSAFDFEDSAGIAPRGEGGARMFAVCSKWGLRTGNRNPARREVELQEGARGRGEAEAPGGGGALPLGRPHGDSHGDTRLGVRAAEPRLRGIRGRVPP